MEYLLFLTYLYSSFEAAIGVHVLKLGYRVTPEPNVNAPDYNGLMFVSHRPENNTSVPERIRNALDKVDRAETEVKLLEVGFRSGRTMVFVPTGPVSVNEDVWKFDVAGKKAMKRALEEKFSDPLLVLQEDEYCPHAELVTLIGALEVLYVDFKHREENPNAIPKIKNLGVWGPEFSTTIDIVNIAMNFEDGRIVARDIADTVPERMTPQSIEEYVREVIPPDCHINISVIADPEVLKKDFPLFASINGGDKDGRIIVMTYERRSRVVDTVLLVGNGVTDKAGAAAVAGFMRVLSETEVGGLKIVAAMPLAGRPNIADQVVTARSGKRVKITSADAALVDILSYMKELVEKKEAAENPQIISIGTLTGEAANTVGFGNRIISSNGPAVQTPDEEAHTFVMKATQLGIDLKSSIVSQEDIKGYSGAEIVQANKHATDVAAFLIAASGLDKHDVGCPLPIKYTHFGLTPAKSPGQPDVSSTGAPVMVLSNRYIMRIHDPSPPGYH